MKRAAAAILSTLALAGCGEKEEATPAKIRVVATTTQVADIVRTVGGGRVDVRGLLEPSADPHYYEPRPSDARALAAAELVFRSGGEVDDWLGGLVRSAGGGVAVVDLGVPGRDAHWWHDPRNGVRAVAQARDRLARADPGGRAGYRRRAAAYAARLRALDRSIAACIRSLPATRRKLVTSHDSLGFYARRYGLEVVGALIPSLSSQAQPSARDTQRLVRQIERERVRAIFPESSLNPRLERAVARETGARAGGALWADSLGPAGSSGATYASSLRANTRAIAAGLSGGRRRC